MRHIYTKVRRQIQLNELDCLNDDLNDFDVKNSNVDEMLAILTTTAPVKSELPNRKYLYQLIKKELKIRKELNNGILDGLK